MIVLSIITKNALSRVGKELFKRVLDSRVWFPDSRSIEAPWSLDYIVIAVRHLTLRLLPWIVRSGIALWLLIKLFKKLQKKLRKRIQ